MRLQLSIAIALILCFPTDRGQASRSSAASRRIQIAGTYSNLTFDEESGDLLGLEIKIVPIVGERYQAAVLESEDEPQPLDIADVQFTGQAVAFEVHGEGAPSWSFRGTVMADALKGTVTRTQGGRQSVTLRRQCGYWDH